MDFTFTEIYVRDSESISQEMFNGQVAAAALSNGKNNAKKIRVTLLGDALRNAKYIKFRKR